MGVNEAPPHSRLHSKRGGHWRNMEYMETCVPFYLFIANRTRRIIPGGTRGALTGMMFGSVFCAVGQLLYNELGVQRVMYISRTGPAASPRPSLPISSGITELPVPKEPLLDRMIHTIGLKRVSDERYLAQLREERAAYLRKIAELEAKVQADEDS